MTLTVGSLFTGIGGLDLGLERAGMTVVWQSEIDPYCCRVLAKHWPDVPNLGDIRDIDWRRVERVDVICGGYPCQPFSIAGKRRGAEDSRHLWPQFADAIRTLQPRYALLENVYGHLSKGFGEVVAELSSIGYDAEWDCIPAAAVGAPHLRDRVLAIATPISGDVANTNCDNASERGQCALVSQSGRGWGDDRSGSGCIVGEVGLGCAGEDSGNVAGPDDIGRDGRPWIFRPARWQKLADRCRHHGHAWTVEPDVGRVAHGIPSRVDRLRALGNAVVPQVAELVGQMILEDAKATQ